MFGGWSSSTIFLGKLPNQRKKSSNSLGFGIQKFDVGIKKNLTGTLVLLVHLAQCFFIVKFKYFFFKKKIKIKNPTKSNVFTTSEFFFQIYAPAPKMAQKLFL